MTLVPLRDFERPACFNASWLVLFSAFAFGFLSHASAQQSVPKTAPTLPTPQVAGPRVEPDILSLKPTIVQYQEDGLFTSKVCLKSPKARVLFSTPGGFKLDESASTLTLVSREDNTATVQVVASRIPLLPLDTGDRRKLVRETILATAPKDATRAAIVSETENPFPINGWMTFQYTMSYGLYGQTYRKQIVFVRLHPYQELQFTAHAPEAMFGRTATALRSVLYSWYREPLKK